MFDRNIHVFSKEEQEKLKNSSVGIVGCGGMGGVSAQIVARSGVQKITVADPDIYNEVNINNQFNAFKSTLGKNKAEVVGKMLNDINPSIEVSVYKEGLMESNVKEIVKKSDIILDCVDYNELFCSYILSNEARKNNKYVLAPQAIGYGGSVLVFDPKGMSFIEYLDLKENMTRNDFKEIFVSPEKYAPIVPKYMSGEIVQKVVKREIPIPNIGLAQTLLSSMMVSEMIFILLNKRKPTTIPNIIALDLLEKKLII